MYGPPYPWYNNDALHSTGNFRIFSKPTRHSKS